MRHTRHILSAYSIFQTRSRIPLSVPNGCAKIDKNIFTVSLNDAKHKRAKILAKLSSHILHRTHTHTQGLEGVAAPSCPVV